MSLEAFPSVEADDVVAPIAGRRSVKRARNRASSLPVAPTSEDPDASDAEISLEKSSRQKGNPVKHRAGSFPALGLCPELCSSLNRKGYGFPTPIQRRVIPSVLAGRDVVAMARTGSGKTAAFLTPVLHRLVMNPCPVASSAKRNGPRALILAPTRELALQTLRFFKAYGRELEPRVRAAVLVGGTPIEAQFESLAVCPELVIATPGRLLQMLAEMGQKGGFTLSAVESLVLDEADRLFESTLATETRAVIDHMTPETEVYNSERQTVLVSATMPRALAEFTRSCLRPNVDVLRLDADKTLSPTLAMSFLVTRSGDEKAASLVTTVRQVLSSGSQKSMVIFVATHRGVEYIVQLLRCVLRGSGSVSVDDNAGIVCVHGHMDQGARVESVSQFRKKEARVLVVTDVAARGIDLPDLDVVVNYDMAPAPKLFVHRVGRVGRAGRPGMAINLLAADEVPFFIDTSLFLGRGIQLAKDEGDNNTKSALEHHAFAMEANFLVGGLPKSCVNDDVELVNKLIENSCELAKLRQSSVNAQGLYVRTRALPSGESVRRAKELYRDGNGEMTSLVVHPWFQDMENVHERTARIHVSKLATWRPKELAVAAPGTRLRRKERSPQKETNSGSPGDSDQSDDDLASDEAGRVGNSGMRLSQTKPALNQDNSGGLGASESSDRTSRKKKRSARQAEMEAQRAQFFVPLRREDADIRNEEALALGRDGTRGGDGLGAFRAVQDAQMDIVADTNEEMRKGNSKMFWDRVSKKFVKGGVTSKTSKQNVHVASREAKARSGGNPVSEYGTADGSLFKAWLNKNKKVVDQMREAGEVGVRNHGLGSNDFRRGAHGRGARIAALAAKAQGGAGPSGSSSGRFRSAKPELKSAPQIKKERKLKAKAEARRIAKAKGKGRLGPSQPRPGKRTGAPSRSKQLIYKKGN